VPKGHYFTFFAQNILFWEASIVSIFLGNGLIKLVHWKNKNKNWTCTHLFWCPCGSEHIIAHDTFQDTIATTTLESKVHV
jgi:hypothetical protein